MQNANAQSTTTPVVRVKGSLPSLSSNTHCLLPSNTLINAIIRAKAKQRTDERGAAYQELLKQFHKAIIPAFLAETGSISKASNLLGIHRETLTKYIDLAGISAVGTGGAAL